MHRQPSIPVSTLAILDEQVLARLDGDAEHRAAAARRIQVIGRVARDVDQPEARRDCVERVAGYKPEIRDRPARICRNHRHIVLRRGDRE